MENMERGRAKSDCLWREEKIEKGRNREMWKLEIDSPDSRAFDKKKISRSWIYEIPCV